MGGDGGVIASNRKYMRGAGTADHTGDSGTASTSSAKKQDPAVEREEMLRSMKTCAVSNKPLHFHQADDNNNSGGGTIVACPYGRLYNREAAVEALLRRKRDGKQQKEGKEDELGSHIRGLKDLYNVRFHLVKGQGDELIPTCPIRGTELNGQIPAVVLVPGGQVNVVSERAIQEMGEQAISEDYGPIHEKIRLAPSAAALVEIKRALSEKRRLLQEETQANKKKKHKQDKKRKRDNQPSERSSKEEAKAAKDAVTAAESSS
jgi:Rtf2 RING-finger